jgi:polysaccharide biosynthesis protein PslJ
MATIAARGERRSLLPALVLVGAAGLLTVSVAQNFHVSAVAPLVLLAALVAAGYRVLFRWESLLAAIVLVIFLIPIKRYTLPSELPFNLEPYRLLIAFVAVAWLASLLIDKRVRLRASGLEAPIALFVFAALASVVVNGSRIESVGLTSLVVKTLTFFASFFVLFYVVVSVVDRREHLERLVRLLVSAGTLVSFAAIVDSRTGYNVFNHLGSALPFLTYHDPATAVAATTAVLDRSGRLRVYASAEHPIELSAVLVMLIPLAFYLAKASGRRRWFFMAGVLGLGALATVSRTGVIMMVVLGLVLLRLRPADVKRFAPLLVPAICALYFALPHTLGSFYSAFFPKGGLIADQSTTVTGNSAGADGRLADIGPSLHEWAQKPVFGEGFGSRVVSRDVNTAPDVPRSRLLDDQWLGSLLEIGFVGICALLWLFIRPIRRMFRIAREDDGDDGWLAAALAASLFGFAIGMLTFDALGFVQVTITFFLLLALSSVLRSLYEEKRAGQQEAGLNGSPA